MTIRTRSKLLCSALSAVAGATALASPAQAACDLTSPTTLTCGPTITTDTGPSVGFPSIDRYYDLTASGVTNVDINALVNGYGLSVLSDGVLTVNNTGTVAANLGSPSVGGTSALNLSGSEIFYYGANSPVLNFFAGNAITLTSNDGNGGTAIDAYSGSVLANNGSGIVANQTNVNGGVVQVTTTAGDTVTVSNGNGITATTNGIGSVFINSNADIVEGAGGSLFNGIYVNQGGLGDVNVFSNGTIGDSVNRVDNGITTSVALAGTAGDTVVASNAAIYADSVGIDASTAGTGDVSVTNNALIDSGGIGIQADTTTGLLTLNANGSVVSAGTAAQLSTAGGNVAVNGAGSLTSTGGVGLQVQSNGGNQTYNLTGNVSGASLGADLVSSGGDITGSLGGLSSNAGAGLLVISGGGLVDLTTNGAVSGGTYGVDISSGNAPISLTTNGTVFGDSVGAISLIGGTGAIDLTTNAAVSSNGFGVRVQNAAAQTIDINGPVNSAGNAITLTSTTGLIDADISGNLTSTAGIGFSANTTTGNQDITLGGNVNASSTGVNVSTTTGNVLANVSGDVTSSDAGGILASTQSGALDFTTSGDITALGAASEGVFLRSTGGAGTGNLSLTTLAGSTIEARNVGVHVENYNVAGTGTVTVTNGADIMAPAAGTLSTGILATNQGLGSVTVANTGNIGTSTSRLGANGIWGYVFNAGSSAPLTISNGAGSIYASTGISAVNVGTGATTVTTGTGRVDGTINGIAASGNAGLMTITTGTGLVTGGTYGINATSTGVQDLNINGAVSGTGAGSVGLRSSTSGARTIDIASGASITGTASAIDLVGTGATTITNGGTLSGPAIVRNTGTGAVTFRNLAGASTIGAAAFSDAADTIDNSGTYTFTGATNLAGGDDVVVNRSGGTMTVNGSIDFGAGTDSLTNEAGGTLNTVTGSTIANLETLGNAGTMNVAGTLGFTGVAPTFSNTGTLNLTGAAVTGLGATTNASGASIVTSGTSSLASTGLFTNAGTITSGGPLAITATGGFTNTGTIDADAGAVTVTTPTFTNGGTIDLQDGAIGDTLTINGAYVGSTGARLTVDSTDSLADLLVVTGAISGTTAVDANLIGTGALVSGGVQVVDGRSTSTADAFVLGNLTGNAGPLATYSITQVGADYFLNASVTDAGFQPLAAATMVPDLWHPSADEVFANLNVPDKGGAGIGGWVQAYGSRDKRGENDFTQTVGGVDYTIDTRVKTTHYGLQGGVDYGFAGTTGRVGVTGGVGKHKGNGLFDIDANGWNLGLYGAFGGETGAHGEILAKHDRNTLEFQDGTFDGDKVKAKSNGIEGQLGYRMPMGGEGANLDLTAGLSHVWNKLSGLSAYNLDYRYDDLDSIRGRLGARYNLGGALQPYVSATALHEFSRNGTLLINDGINDFAVETRKKGTWGRVEGGIGGKPNAFPMVAAWADFGDVKGIGARLGMRFGGGAEMLPPPPVAVPAPAPEPAPATQTCYDGSVILATDTCPVPPPPPAPTPAPERG